MEGVREAGLCWAEVQGVGGKGSTSWVFAHPLWPPRSHLAEAAALYSLVDEQLHVLATVSNHLLRRLGWSSPYRLINMKDRIFSEVIQNPKTIT